MDFTSRPRRRKPITCLHCAFDGDRLRAQNLEELPDFTAFENTLQRPGPWIAGIDFPFGQSRRFIENIGWPQDWKSYVLHAASLGREGFRDALTAYRQPRAKGDKEHRRETDKAAKSISPQKLYGVPVALMFFEGALRLIDADVTVPHLQTGDPDRVVVEAYPGVLARSLIGRRSYKNDSRKKQTVEKLVARCDIFDLVTSQAMQDRFGFGVEADASLADDPTGDRLDALLCAIQAAWAWRNRDECFGAPTVIDPLEGWIADPIVSKEAESLNATPPGLSARPEAIDSVDDE